MARTGRSKPLVWLILGALAGVLAALLTTPGCERRRSPPEEDKTVVVDVAAPPSIEKPAPRPRAALPAELAEPAPALSDEAQLAEDAAASGMTTTAPRDESVE